MIRWLRALIEEGRTHDQRIAEQSNKRAHDERNEDHHDRPPLCQGCSTRSPVPVDRQPVMGMAVDVVKGLSALGGRVHVHCHAGHVRDVVEHLVANFLRHRVPLRDREVGVHRDIQLEGETMAGPASSHLGNIVDAWYVPRRLLDGVQDRAVAASAKLWSVSAKRPHSLR